MDTDTVRAVLGWSAVLGYGLLLVWFGALALARERVYRLHRRWFALEDRQFDAIHYALMGGFKLALLLLFVLPWLALRILG